MRNFRGIYCRLIFSRSNPWHACVEFKHFDNLYCKQQKLALVFETELLN